jgi:hypothetical protein
VLLLKTTGTTPLSEPDVDAGFVSRLDIELQTSSEGAIDGATVGQLHVAIIHIAEAMNQNESIYEVLDADSAELEALYHVFLEDASFNERYENGAGSDRIYFERVEIVFGWHGRGIEEAAIQRVIQTSGHGCAIAVMPVADVAEVARWARLGFVPARDPSPGVLGYSTRDLSLKHPRVREVDVGADSFAIEAEPN